jgi:hypothetical protein
MIEMTKMVCFLCVYVNDKIINDLGIFKNVDVNVDIVKNHTNTKISIYSFCLRSKTTEKRITL